VVYTAIKMEGGRRKPKVATLNSEEETYGVKKRRRDSLNEKKRDKADESGRKFNLGPRRYLDTVRARLLPVISHIIRRGRIVKQAGCAI